MLPEGVVAVLVGAGRENGVGAAIAKLLIEQGCNIVINCLKNKQQAESVVEQCRKSNMNGK